MYEIDLHFVRVKDIRCDKYLNYLIFKKKDKFFYIISLICFRTFMEIKLVQKCVEIIYFLYETCTRDRYRMLSTILRVQIANMSLIYVCMESIETRRIG